MSLRPRSSLMSLGMILFVAACAHQPNAAAETAPAVAAEYRTTYESGERKERQVRETTWRLWRETNRITTENLSAHTGEVWQRDDETLFHQKVFHDDRKSVEFQMDDLRINNVPTSWPRQLFLLDPALLQRLSLRDSGWRGGYPYRRYVGESDGSRWDITIRTDLQVPVQIERERHGAREVTKLQSAHALSAAPWSPTSREDYEFIDFADFGDRQRDPFVAKVQDQLGRPHNH